MDSWFWQRLMVYTWTYGIDNTHGIDLDSWYRIGTPESHTYKRAECYLYAGFFLNLLIPLDRSPYMGQIVQTDPPLLAVGIETS